MRAKWQHTEHTYIHKQCASTDMMNQQVIGGSSTGGSNQPRYYTYKLNLVKGIMYTFIPFLSC